MTRHDVVIGETRYKQGIQDLRGFLYLYMTSLVTVM